MLLPPIARPLHPVDLLRALSRPLAPVPTGLAPVLPRLAGIRAVIFDIYGTLFISGAGDPGAEDHAPRETALRAILRDRQLAVADSPGSLTGRLRELIDAAHARARHDGISYPEVEIRDLWAELLDLPRGPLLESVAIAYECAVNPVWPMPGAEALLHDLRQRGAALGIVSNAQFYTPHLFEAFFRQPLPALGFPPELSFFSYRHRRAKPDLWLFERLRDALASRGIAPAETLYLGNDALKDIHPAATLGFRTALFAGDARSLRLHHDQRALRPPDAIVTDLSQVLRLLG